MAPLNQIQQKLSALKIESTTFVHPLANAADMFAKITNLSDVHEFEILGVKFLIEGIEDSSILSGGMKGCYSVAVREGNTLLFSLVNLFSWEWLYLVKGHDAVNQAGYLIEERLTNEQRYISSSEYNKEIEHWEDIAREDPEKAAMPAHIKSCYQPATIDEDGVWHKA
ncbi:hypothetical protein OTK49_28290 [Vibrio coralliirubri]|uniref:hypothetical protein n=1 Tax=Vibrio coralliirubri TaxID=1516159 RepID=UPI002284F3EC|nr:hypothetical protein [Vibrio coralliirubri]MCY9866443.1 hypothetical protein [Vibrio coralliirubri]